LTPEVNAIKYFHCEFHQFCHNLSQTIRIYANIGILSNKPLGIYANVGTISSQKSLMTLPPEVNVLKLFVPFANILNSNIISDKLFGIYANVGPI
jgi:hypothetical protein